MWWLSLSSLLCIMTSSLSNTTSDHSVRFLTLSKRKECQRLKQKILHNISTHCSKITVCVPLGSAHWTPSNFTVLIILYHLEHFLFNYFSNILLFVKLSLKSEDLRGVRIFCLLHWSKTRTASACFSPEQIQQQHFPFQILVRFSTVLVTHTLFSLQPSERRWIDLLYRSEQGGKKVGGRKELNEWKNKNKEQ